MRRCFMGRGNRDLRDSSEHTLIDAEHDRGDSRAPYGWLGKNPFQGEIP
jgi:hypothetical protein